MMKEAIKIAQSAENEVPVGAIICDKNGNIISSTHNLVEQNNNPTAHAEMLAIELACQKLGNKYLDFCDIYITLEPCPMCAAAISLARIRRVYFGAYDVKNVQQHTAEIYGGIKESECKKLLQDFFAAKRG